MFCGRWLFLRRGGRLFVMLLLCCVVCVVAVRRGWEMEGYSLQRPRRWRRIVTVWTTWHGCHVVFTTHTLLLLLSVLSSVCAVGVVNHGSWQWWLLARCSGWWEWLASMVVVGREGLLVVCSLLMTTNQALEFADARFGCSEE